MHVKPLQIPILFTLGVDQARGVIARKVVMYIEVGMVLVANPIYIMCSGTHTVQPRRVVTLGTLAAPRILGGIKVASNNTRWRLMRTKK